MSEKRIALPLPIDEQARQQAVDRSGVLGRRGTSELMQVVEGVTKAYGVPIGLISIIDRRRQWLAAKIGLDIEETARVDAFCNHVLRRPGEPLVVGDARLDARFKDNPLVKGSPFVRFYAGAPLLDSAGYPLGALCILDSKPRRERPELFQLISYAWQAERIVAP